jgi:hypothetical protein
MSKLFHKDPENSKEALKDRLKDLELLYKNEQDHLAAISQYRHEERSKRHNALNQIETLAFDMEHDFVSRDEIYSRLLDIVRNGRM